MKTPEEVLKKYSCSSVDAATQELTYREGTVHMAMAEYAIEYYSETMKKTNWVLKSECKPDALSDRARQAETDLREALDLLEYFTNRVELGTIRSKTTYAMYVNFLSKFRAVGCSAKNNGA